MENTISLFRLVHRISLSALLLLIATIPLIVTIDMVTAFVIMPAFLIFIFLVSILVDQKLTSLTIVKPTNKKTSACAKKRCLLRNCLG